MKKGTEKMNYNIALDQIKELDIPLEKYIK